MPDTVTAAEPVTIRAWFLQVGALPQLKQFAHFLDANGRYNLTVTQTAAEWQAEYDAWIANQPE
jgi:hypothetical protein